MYIPQFIFILAERQFQTIIDISVDTFEQNKRFLSASFRNLKKCLFVDSLKGHCHAIWQLYKKLEGIFASIESKTNDLV